MLPRLGVQARALERRRDVLRDEGEQLLVLLGVAHRPRCSSAPPARPAPGPRARSGTPSQSTESTPRRLDAPLAPPSSLLLLQRQQQRLAGPDHVRRRSRPRRPSPSAPRARDRGCRGRPSRRSRESSSRRARRRRARCRSSRRSSARRRRRARRRRTPACRGRRRPSRRCDAARPASARARIRSVMSR